ncbi:MAG: hypothetical protein ACP5P3_05380 [Ignavibacteria bacterium]
MAKKKTQTIVTDVSTLSETKMKKIIAQFCAHLEKGFSEHSFGLCDVEKIEEIISILDSKERNNYYYERVKAALRANLYFWERVGITGLKNKKNFNSSMWMFYLKLRFNKKFNYTELNNNKVDKKIEIDFTEK